MKSVKHRNIKNVYIIQAFPLVIVLMTQKSRSLYQAVMRLIARTFQECFPDTPITITGIVSYFELGMMGAVPDVRKPGVLVSLRASDYKKGENCT